MEALLICVGRKQYGGQNTYMPIKVNMSGVLPIIFASTFLAIPGTIVGFVDPKMCIRDRVRAARPSAVPAL